MKNRFVRWTIYFAIGIAIGIGVSFYQKQQKMDEGVIEVTLDDLQEESIKIPNREETLAVGAEALQGAKDILESIEENIEAVKENVEEIITADENAEESTISENIEEAVETMENVVGEDAAVVEDLPPALTPMPE
ncbi:MAG: hypothetical protein KAJ40_07520 [Alphaproteobacteria bacterium]|nr:hypothetical protein [Alphaproteobacteria bacterium]